MTLGKTEVNSDWSNDTLLKLVIYGTTVSKLFKSNMGLGEVYMPFLFYGAVLRIALT